MKSDGDYANLSKLEDEVRGMQESAPESPFLYRGVANADWPLTTTLERYTGGLEMPFADYYRQIRTVLPQIETFTDQRWDIAEYSEILGMAEDYDEFDRHLWSGQLKAYGYMAYLRHHGFPSPLLDWTRSLYVAAFFAFRSAIEPPSGRVSIFVYCEKPFNTKGSSSSSAQIFRMGQYVRTHRRHFLQQGEYTMCLRWKPPWHFVPHQKVFDSNELPQDLLWKYTLPWSERVNVLRTLDEHNVNAFSLFEDHGALLETLALRRFILERRSD